MESDKDGLAGARRDPPWIFRTYAGHSTARESNALYRANLARGQTGLSVAFDLPTQVGYDADHPLAKGEVGRVGVPVGHLGDMRALFDGLDLAAMNTSMTINATAPWLMALYVALADEKGAPRAALQGTTQNDIVKEYLSRGAYAFPPAPSLRLSSDLILFCLDETPKWNPINVCSYHLQEAGATPVQELSYALATAIAVLDHVRPKVEASKFDALVGRVSFFVNAGMRFVEETAKMRAFVALWDEIAARRYGVSDAKLRRFRYGVQVNSLGLTERQPENNAARILIEMLSVVLSKNARARAVQLPAWNEALGLPRPFDQQWSLRMQQIMAYETDLLEYDDLFDGNPAMERLVARLADEARSEIAALDAAGGMLAAVERGAIKERLVESNTRRLEAIERGERIVVGVNAYAEGEASPFPAGTGAIQEPSAEAEAEQVAALRVWRAQRDGRRLEAALERLKAAALGGVNVMPASIEAAKAGATTGEWAQTMRAAFGEYRAPTGLRRTARQTSADLDPLRAEVERLSMRLGRRVCLLIGKPGLDGHSNGAEQIAARAIDAGFDVVYEGIRSTPEALVEAAKRRGAHCIGLSVLSGAHVALAREVAEKMRAAQLGSTPLVLGGVIPDEDARALLASGVAAIYTPKDYKINAILNNLLALIGERSFGRAG